jgi:hypothetical protein
LSCLCKLGIPAAEDFNPTRFIAGFQRFTAAADMCPLSLTCGASVLFILSLVSRISGLFSATGELENKKNQGYDEQDMDEPTGNMERKSAAPKQQKKNGDNQKHASESNEQRLCSCVVWPQIHRLKPSSLPI